MRQRPGDLSLEFATIGRKVRCIALPNIDVWQKQYPRQSFKQPQPQQIYRIRGSVFTLNFRGICLVEVVNPGVASFSVGADTLVGEPFFAYHFFNVVY